jgi:Coenzyme PQQ synthesis protein D (PqqD)
VDRETAVRARALPVLDRVERDGESVVLAGRQVVRLSALATALLDACRDWCVIEDLAGELVAQFGDPPWGDARSVTAAALTELRDQGLVELG